MKVSDRQITSLNSKVNNNIAANMRILWSIHVTRYCFINC